MTSLILDWLLMIVLLKPKVPIHPMQPSQGATAPTAIQMGNAALQPIIAPPAVPASNASLMQQQPVMSHSQQIQPQQLQQQTLVSKQNKVTPIAKPAGLDPVVILQVCNLKYSK
jgi:hypothetical protein